MFILIVGVGRVGTALARRMLEEGHQVSCLDEDPDSLQRLEAKMEAGWVESGGSLTIGQALESDALIAAGIERAHAFIAATDGDNTNIIVAQIAKKRFNVPTVIARVLDPFRAAWYEEQGLRTISPTRSAIEMLEAELFSSIPRGGE